MLRKLLTPFSAAVLLIGLTSCASAEASPADNAPTVSVSDSTILIDVRTPEEFAQGHLDGALLLDLTGGDFANALPGLDPDAEYLVYCRSGNRSGQAIALMQQRGITNTTNLGSVEQASAATGIPIVTD